MQIEYQKNVIDNLTGELLESTSAVITKKRLSKKAFIKTFAEDIAMEADWIKENDKNYCPDCFTYDDDDNLLIIPILGDVV